jgi:histone acetyltransferase (RNA polymerase elongator complex component)
MNRYQTISLTPAVVEKNGKAVGVIEVYDFMNKTTKRLDNVHTIGEAIDIYNDAGFYVSAVDRIEVDPIKENRIIIMTKEILRMDKPRPI